MTSNIFQDVKSSLQGRLDTVLADLLPGGKIAGREYVCGSLGGGAGDSCKTNLDTGVGSDFATGESWRDIISLYSKMLNIRQGEAARELADRYHIALSGQTDSRRAVSPVEVPLGEHSVPPPPQSHPQHGKASAMWHYTDKNGKTLAYTARFDAPDGSKVVLPLLYGKNASGHLCWLWKALPEPRPMYGLQKLSAMPEAPVLLVEGEKTADAAQVYFPDYAVLTWSGGANAVGKADFSPLQGKNIIIWPDNDEAGFKAALALAELLKEKSSVYIVLPPDSLPEKWDLADATEPGFIPQIHIATALSITDFTSKAHARYPQLAQQIVETENADEEELSLKEWPVFSLDACPGLLGDFVKLATRDSEADPAAIAITALVRFCAEVYGHAPDRGPHVYVGETVHPPRLFAVICGNSSKARKGTSRHPVTKLFGREYCSLADLRSWGLPLPARESGGPLSTGEGLAHHIRDETDEERERRQRQNPNESIREKGDKRLIIQDEEFASGLACTKREGNTLSMGIRCFWDSGDYSPLTKNNPVSVKGAHISIITHITMQELAVCLGDVQAFNGFGNRFLWICARRSKLVPLPARMPESDLAPMQNEVWRLVSHAQQCGPMSMTARARDCWEGLYTDLSKEHSGLAGSIINRAEAQTLRLALVYALLDGQKHIEETHLQSALAMWQYAQDSALYIFGGRASNPLEEKIMEALKKGPLTATELSAVFNRNISKDVLRPILQQMEAQRRIILRKEQGSSGRSRQIIMLYEMNAINEKNETDEFNENRNEPCVE